MAREVRVARQHEPVRIRHLRDRVLGNADDGRSSGLGAEGDEGPRAGLPMVRHVVGLQASARSTDVGWPVV